VKIATWNVNSILARLPLVLKWLDAAKPDVVCLQELKCVDDKFPREAIAELGYVSEAYGQPTYNGVAILSRTPIENVQRGFHDDEVGAHARLIAGTVNGIRVVNVYIPNGHEVGTDKYIFKLKWMLRLRKFFNADYSISDTTLLCGDFNVAPEDRDVHDPQRWEGKILCSKRERAALEEIKGWGFTDAFRMHTEADGHYSWWDYRAGAFPRNHGLRIDHIWISEPLSKRCTASWIDVEPRSWERPSDHTPVVADFN
jgi:exodeoxyribonuclease-3